MTEQQRQQAIQNNPRIRHFVESGDSEQASRLISMAYLLFTIGNAYTEQANDIIERHGLYHFNLKYLGNNLQRAFDKYNLQLRSMINSDEACTQLLADYDIFEAVCSKFMNNDLENRESATSQKTRI